MTLPAEQAAGLLDALPAAYHAKVSDLLLTALALAVARWTGTDIGVLVELEGHGRVELEPGIDLSRTVGWFTAAYPVRLDAGVVPWAEVLAGGAALAGAIKRVKEQIRALPDDGIGYGLLRHLNPDGARALSEAPAPQLGFNYLGRLAAPENTAWSLAEEADALTDGLDPNMAAPHGIQLDVLARDGMLHATWSYAGGTYREAAIRELAELWRAALTGLAAHGAAPEAGGHTPSDIALVNVDQDELEEFELFLGDHG